MTQTANGSAKRRIKYAAFQPTRGTQKAANARACGGQGGARPWPPKKAHIQSPAAYKKCVRCDGTVKISFLIDYDADYVESLGGIIKNDICTLFLAISLICHISHILQLALLWFHFNKIPKIAFCF